MDTNQQPVYFDRMRCPHDLPIIHPVYENAGKLHFINSIKQCRHNNRKRDFKWKLSNLLFPVLHAKEKEEDTSMDKLMRSKPTIIVTDSEILQHLQNETGQERLNQMFTKSHNGEYSPDLEFVFSAIRTSSIVTFGIASVYGTRAAREKVVRKQQHQKFEHQIKAVRKYNDALLVGAFKTGFTYALKTGLFIGMYTLTANSIAAYRNKSSVIEYVAAGGITGACAKIMLGPRGMVGGAAVGGTLGLIGGVMILLILTSSNATFEQRHYWYVHELLKQKKEYKMMASGE